MTAPPATRHPPPTWHRHAVQLGDRAHLAGEPIAVGPPGGAALRDKRTRLRVAGAGGGPEKVCMPMAAARHCGRRHASYAGRAGPHKRQRMAGPVAAAPQAHPLWPPRTPRGSSAGFITWALTPALSRQLRAAPFLLLLLLLLRFLLLSLRCCAAAPGRPLLHSGRRRRRRRRRCLRACRRNRLANSGLLPFHGRTTSAAGRGAGQAAA